MIIDPSDSMAFAAMGLTFLVAGISLMVFSIWPQRHKD